MWQVFQGRAVDREDPAHRYEWYVDSKRAVDVPAGTFTDCYRVQLSTLPDMLIRWVCPRVGITAVEYTHQGDRDLAQVTTQELRGYLNYMRAEYTPRRITGDNDRKLSRKTIHNIWISLSSFFCWASEEFDIPSPMKGVPAPKYEKAQVQTFTKEEIEALLKACEYCREAKTDQRRKFTMRRPTARRDRAIILTLLDTGLRAGELCALRIGDVDLKTGKVIVRHGTLGGAKGGKGRTVFMGRITRRAVWRYLVDREDGDDPEVS
jgi:integrase/recombinase XerD